MKLSSVYKGRKNKTFYGSGGTPYLTVDRYFKINLFGRWLSVCKHTFHRGDEDPDCHDHPFHFISIILRGRYIEMFQNGEQHLRKKGSIAFRPAKKLHRIRMYYMYSEKHHPVTFCIKFDAKRDWGFMTKTGWVYWKDYLRAKGVTPLEEEVHRYPCGKIITDGKGITNANTGCGEFNCGPCNKFIYRG